ncbi:MAG: RluA family pseudouridine synthase [Campylobacteraceae bacterium]|jgi:23S rRNA pseudouridine1911/1915/1917 synthase|nr:RluA family pseudouridine synthase [Campylobacteraceae bacterium]
MPEKKFTCSAQNIRLDHFLTTELNVSRNRITELIKSALVSVNGTVQTKAGLKLNENDTITIEFPEPKKIEKYKVDFDVPIIFEDDDILIINKPPYLTVHPAPSVKEPTLVDWLKAKNISLSTLSGEERNGIVHRIDKETSGALIVAKNNAAHANLAKQLENRTLGRYYLALIDYPLKNDTIVDKPIGRNPKNRLKMAVTQNGKAAKSAFCSLLTNESEEIELIAAKLFTGRTHQIRVHLNALGRHILGDDLYGFKSQKDKINRVMLHAYCLYLIHPASGKKMIFTAPLYDDFKEELLKFFTKENINETLHADTITLRFDTVF